MTEAPKRCPTPMMSKTSDRDYLGSFRWKYQLECGFKLEMEGDLKHGPRLREPCPRCIMLMMDDKTTYRAKQ